MSGARLTPCHDESDYVVLPQAMDRASTIFGTDLPKDLVQWYRSGQDVERCLPILSNLPGTWSRG